MRLLKHEYTAGLGSSNQDVIIAACPLPPNTRLNHFRAEIGLTGNATTDFRSVVAYAVIGSFLEVPDPDAVVSYQTLWDTQQDKGGTAVSVGRDEATANTAPIFQPGEYDMEGLYMIGNSPPRFYDREKLLSFSKDPTGLNWALNTSADFIPKDHFIAESTRRFTTNRHMVAALALSLPDWASVTHSSSAGNIPTLAEWSMLQFLDDMIDKAFIDAIGIHEPGSESPYEDINDWLAPFLEDAWENAAGPFFAIDALQWNLHVVWDFTVQGTINKGVASVHTG